MEPPRILLGLGNPGLRYRRTRHNLGFLVLDRLATLGGARFELDRELTGKAWTAELELSSGDVVLAKPRTYMNRSGRAAAALCRRYDVAVDRLLVVCDDADLELGRIRIRPSGSPGGHNGLRSIIDALGSQEFARIKLGVRGAGRDEMDLADYVLSSFDAAERAVADALVELAVDAVRDVLDRGVAAAMNRYNGLRAGLAEPGRSGDGEEDPEGCPGPGGPADDRD